MPAQYACTFGLPLRLVIDEPVRNVMRVEQRDGFTVRVLKRCNQ
jgi:hypothetical protein